MADVFELLNVVIRQRRSVKPAALDSRREIPRALIERLVENVCLAPTHGMTEPWRFLVFTGAARERLCEALPAVYDAVTPLESRSDRRNAKNSA